MTELPEGLEDRLLLAVEGLRGVSKIEPLESYDDQISIAFSYNNMEGYFVTYAAGEQGNNGSIFVENNSEKVTLAALPTELTDYFKYLLGEQSEVNTLKDYVWNEVNPDHLVSPIDPTSITGRSLYMALTSITRILENEYQPLEGFGLGIMPGNNFSEEHFNLALNYLGVLAEDYGAAFKHAEDIGIIEKKDPNYFMTDTGIQQYANIEKSFDAIPNDKDDFQQLVIALDPEPDAFHYSAFEEEIDKPNQVPRLNTFVELGLLRRMGYGNYSYPTDVREYIVGGVE
ncbi:MAG: hypothetical protein KKF44_07090 [Nanoarchaeota archaeon]|nr:hypothetical protein [Nanoarchaeota archaeon]